MADELLTMTPLIAPAPPRKDWVRWLLAGSLALNLLVVGVLAGGFLLRPDGAPGRMIRLDLSIQPYTQAFAPEDRAALLRDWRARGPGMRTILAERRAEERAVLAALVTEPFDAQALDAALAGRIARSQAQQALGQALLLERLQAISPVARARYAGRLEAAIARGPRAPREGERGQRP
jgi:uncharacterized membrane protein